MKLAIYFLEHNISKIFQHIINIKNILRRYFIFFALHCLCNLVCILHLEPISVWTSHMSRLSCHMWLVAAILNRADPDVGLQWWTKPTLMELTFWWGKQVISIEYTAGRSKSKGRERDILEE